MSKILVAGLTNIETTLKIDQFPLNYSAVNYPFFGINTTVAGVGYNIAKALSSLGDQINFLTMTGQDFSGEMVKNATQQIRLATDYISQKLENTPQSIILYDGEGRRQIHVDLKDVQEQAYPPKQFRDALEGCDLAVLCNINFTRSYLYQVREAGIPLATDVHTIGQLDSNYDGDYMRAADILFMSNENLPCPPLEWTKQLQERYTAGIIVIGLGAEGALLAVRAEQTVRHFPAVKTRPVVNTIGAGDALFSAFVHYYAKNREPYQAIQKAQLFASYKIGANGAASGFLSEPELEVLYQHSQL